MNIQENDIIIISFPRSGSTYMQFLFCNLFWPEIEHDFKTIHQYVPSLDNAEVVTYIDRDPRIFKTHHNIDDKFKRVIYLIRHIGDILISNYYFQKKFFNLSMPFESWLFFHDYGQEWREHINENIIYLKHPGLKDYAVIFYEDLIKGPYKVFKKLLNRFGYKEFSKEIIEKAIEKSAFNKIKDIELSKGLDNKFAFNDTNILFVRDGRAGQWHELSKELKQKILEKNKNHLCLLNYSKFKDIYNVKT